MLMLMIMLVLVLERFPAFRQVSDFPSPLPPRI
jgi:hypothetical protein